MSRFSRNSGKILGAIVAASLVSLIGVGCGGGGNGSTPSINTREAAIDTIKATRQMAETFTLNDTNVTEEGLRSRTTRAVLRHAKAARANSRANSNDIPEGEGFDEDEGLYYRAVLTPQGFKIVYHEDAARTRPAGYIELAVPDDVTVYFVFRMDKGREPIWGDLQLKYDNANTQAGRLNGWIEDPRTEERVTFDLRLENSDVASGSVTVRTGGNTLRINNLVRDFERRITADIAFAGLTGSLVQAEDGSGTLTINDRGGLLIARYDADGKGSLTLPGGQVIPVADFDTEL